MLVLPALGQSSGTGSAKKASGSDTKSTAPVPDSEGEETEAPPLKFTVAGEQLTFEASGDWKRVKPKSRMLEMEIEVPKAEDDPAAGRLTMMGAGGSIDANIQRWEGQFSQADGTATEADTKQMTIEGMKVTMVDIAGTFSQTMGGPFSGGKKVESPDYRMLAAIIETDGEGNYFIKLVGPAATIKANEAEFEKMVKSVKRETVH
jgi:hypothetical protein